MHDIVVSILAILAIPGLVAVVTGIGVVIDGNKFPALSTFEIGVIWVVMFIILLCGYSFIFTFDPFIWVKIWAEIIAQGFN